MATDEQRPALGVHQESGWWLVLRPVAEVLELQRLTPEHLPMRSWKPAGTLMLPVRRVEEVDVGHYHTERHEGIVVVRMRGGATYRITVHSPRGYQELLDQLVPAGRSAAAEALNRLADGAQAVAGAVPAFDTAQKRARPAELDEALDEIRAATRTLEDRVGFLEGSQS